MAGVVVSDVWQVQGRGWEAVRNAILQKAIIRMQWAQFEENICNAGTC